MDSADILSLFGTPATDQKVEAIFSSLNTLRRPELPEDDPYSYHDWVLIRRKGIELGFSDSEYQHAADRFRWGHGTLLLTQAYFYAGFDDIRPFTGILPYGLAFADNRAIARSKLGVFERSRHSYLNDTWDVDGYRLSVTYTETGASIDRMACRVLATSIPRTRHVVFPDLKAITHAFGATLKSPEFQKLWAGTLTDEDDESAHEDGEMDLLETYGATLAFAPSSVGPVFRSIVLHRNRDMESVGWGGGLPNDLDFEDSPEILFKKIASQPVQQSDSALTGHAVWHFDDYTLHVLYSNLDNRLLRVKLIAPGTWKSVKDVC